MLKYPDMFLMPFYASGPLVYTISGSFIGYYTVENTNGRLDLEGVFDSIGATSRQDFTAVKKGNHIY